MGSSKQLCKNLKMKVIDVHSAGDGHEKIAKRCQLAVSTMGNCKGQDEIWKTKKTLGENCLYAGQRGKSKSPFDCRKPVIEITKLLFD